MNKIQLTETLLYTALCLAHSENYSNGITTFDEQIQEKLIEEFKRLLEIDA